MPELEAPQLSLDEQIEQSYNESLAIIQELKEDIGEK
jgi:hypothetical protein